MALKSQKKSGFQYKSRDQKTIKDRANRKAGLFDSIFKSGFDTFTPKQGDNLVRFLPPTWDDSEHYGYTAFVHNNIGPDNSTYLCLRKMQNKPCPICEASKEAKDAGETEEAKALNTSERVVSWILDREGDDPEKPVIYNQSWTQDRDVTALCVNERTGEILMIDHPDKGFDVAFKRTGTGLKTKYYGWQIERSDSPVNDSEKVQDEILNYVYENPIPDTLNFYDYDYLKGVLSGTVAAKDEALDDDDKPAPKSNTRTASRRTSGKDEETPFDGGRARGPRRDQEVDEEEVEEKTPPPRRGAARKPEPKDDPEENEEDDNPPARTPRREAAPTARARTRVIEEVDEETGEVTEEEDEAPPPRRSARR